MSLTDNPAAVEAAIKAFRAGATQYTMMDINQGPGEGNYDRIEQLQIEDAIRAAEDFVEYEDALRVDEQDTLVMKAPEIGKGD